MANIDPKIGFALKGALGGGAAAAGASGGLAGLLGGSLAAGPAAPIAMGVGLLGTMIASGIRAKRAKDQLKEQDKFASDITRRFGTEMGSLVDLAKRGPVYKPDVSGYQEAQKLAEQQLESRMGRIPGQDIAREQIAQNVANISGMAERGARSSTDFLATLGLGIGQAAEATRASEADFARMNFADTARREQNLLSAIGAKAASEVSQRGLQFQSRANIAQNVLGLSEKKALGGIDLERQLFDEKQAKLGAYADAKAEIFGGAGKLAQQFGTGLMGLNQQSQQFDLLSKLFG